MLTEKQESRVSVQEQLLMCLPSIGSVVATVMAESGISLLDIYNDLDENTLARLKYPTGNAIGLKKAQKICTNKKHMTSQSIASKKVQVRLLSAVPLISKKTAETILETVEFQNIMDGGVDVDLLKDISRGKSKLGQKASSNIISYLLNKSKKD
jgi:Holliday junction resolvasome RuvABC DNA-binding subunit